MQIVELEKLRLLEVKQQDYMQLKEFMKVDFPGLNMIPFVFQKRALQSGILRASYLCSGDSIFGYAVYHIMDELPATQIMYLAVLPEYRSSGLGGRFLQLLRQVKPGYTLLLEVDKPTGNEQAGDKLRRIAFYRRNGFELVPGLVVSVVGHPMLVMTNGQLQANWKRLYKDIYCSIYGSRLFSPMVKVLTDRRS